MAFINEVKKGLLKAGRFAVAGARRTGKTIANAGKVAYSNRDLIAKGVGLAAPVIAAGFAGGPAGAIGTALAEKDQIKSFAGQVKGRVQGKTKGGNVSEADKDKLLGIAGSAGKKLLKKNIDRQAKKRLKTMAQGQSI